MGKPAVNNFYVSPRSCVLVAVRKSSSGHSDDALKHVLVVVASRCSLITADTLIIGLTWWKLFDGITSERGVLSSRRPTLTDIFLRDGKLINRLLIIEMTLC